MKILVADDDPMLRLSLSTLLRRLGYQVVVAHDGAAAWRLLQQPDAPRLAVIDWMMPGMDGVELCTRLRSAADQPYTYVLLLTSRNDVQDIIKGLDAGADDYLTKPAELAELEARLRVGKRIIKLQEDLFRAYQEKQFEASHDSLTALWNRRAILDLLRNQHARALRDQKSLAVMLIDVDHFKNVNDIYGHIVGDAVLSEMAGRMTAMIRECDWIGRYGGEEFIVIAPDCSLSGAAVIAERIRSAIASAPIIVDRRPVSITVSIGFATTNEFTLSTENGVIAAADSALYKAKAKGRNRSEPCGRDHEPALTHHAFSQESRM